MSKIILIISLIFLIAGCSVGKTSGASNSTTYTLDSINPR